jgi:hypothetical protein
VTPEQKCPAFALCSIEPRAVYRPDGVRAALGLAKSTLRREVRLGRLRVSKRGGRYFVLGAWVLEWLRGGELRRREPRLARDTAGDDHAA